MKLIAARSLAALVFAAVAAAVPRATLACTDLAGAPSTRWGLTTEGGVSWLVTPCGERFFSAGVNVLDGGISERDKVGPAYSGYRWEGFAPTLSGHAATSSPVPE